MNCKCNICYDCKPHAAAEEMLQTLVCLQRTMTTFIALQKALSIQSEASLTLFNLINATIQKAGGSNEEKLS